MNLDDPQRRDLLAGEYVLGTLRGPARRRFEHAMERNEALREAVAAWERRMDLLMEKEMSLTSEATPPPEVWQAIERRTAAPPPSNRESGALGGLARLWDSLAFWRGLGLAAAAALLLVVSGIVSTLPQETPGPERVAVVMDQSARPLWVISDKPQGRLAVTTINSPGMAPERVCELWVVFADGTTRSVGILPEGGRAEFRMPAINGAVMPAEARLAVSIEPPGGSTAGRPTGPVIFEGELLAL
jgi:anti-sigma-K factor RskA